MIEREDLLYKELEDIEKHFQIRIKYFHPSTTAINKIFKEYNIVEFTEHWYDSEDEDFLQGRDPLEFNNWIDPFGPGLWGMDQKKANKVAKNMMFEFRKRCYRNTVPKRFWIGKKDNELLIYCYTRDIIAEDGYWFFKRKGC